MCVGVSQHVCVFVAWNAAFLRGSAAESPSSAYSTASLQSIKSGMHQRAHAHAHTHTHTHSICNLQCSRTVYTSHTHTPNWVTREEGHEKLLFLHSQNTRRTISWLVFLFIFSTLRPETLCKRKHKLHIHKSVYILKALVCHLEDKGIVWPKMSICWHPHAHRRCRWVCFFIRFGEISPMDPLQWMGAVRMRAQTADKNIRIIHK